MFLEEKILQLLLDNKIDEAKKLLKSKEDDSLEYRKALFVFGEFIHSMKK